MPFYAEVNKTVPGSREPSVTLSCPDYHGNNSYPEALLWSTVPLSLLPDKALSH